MKVIAKVNFENREESAKIQDNKIVKVTQTKAIIQILSVLKKCDNLSKIHKIDKYTYYTDYPEDDGEILNYNLTENRGQNIAGLKKTFKNIRNIINNNFEGKANELFATLTYAENMTDRERLMIDFDRFYKRFRRKYPNTDYLSVIEPQGRGAWHIHLCLRFNDLDSIFIPNNDVLAPMWGHGWTKIKSMKNVDNIGAYLSAYLADIEITEDTLPDMFKAIQRNEYETMEDDEGNSYQIKKDYVNLKVIEKEIDGVKKSFLKGGRLHMYPSGINLYRCSKGIIKPVDEEIEYCEIKKKIGSRPADFSRTIDILDEEHKLLNSITYENYNLKRDESKYKKTGNKEVGK